MTILEWLHDSMIRLRDAGVDSPRRDCLVLLEDLLGKNRAWVLSHHEHQLTAEQIKFLEAQLQRRQRREPLAYIRGKAWFYGRFFEVNTEVLIPRPESETIIDQLKKIASTKPINTVWDIGTGSGCLAITIKKELPNLHVGAGDISEPALRLAKKNARSHGVNVRFVKSDLLASMPRMPKTREYAIVANLPYVPDNLITSPEIKHEPEQALFSGSNGMQHYRKLWEQIEGLPNKPSLVVTESLENQHIDMARMAKKAGYKLAGTETLIQLYKSVK